jgi:shikimate dehydrogenase
MSDALDARPLWLLGADVEDSPSPAMHNAGLAAMGRPQIYRAQPCSIESLDDVLAEAEATCRGLNVTAPFKRIVAERYPAALDELARRAGAVNTVIFADDGARVATNTDVPGLLEAWRRASVEPVAKTVALVGAGGAARSAVVALSEAGAAEVVAHARRPEAAEEIVALARKEGMRARIGTEEPHATMVVFAVPALHAPDEWLARTLIGPGVVHDLRYGRRARRTRNAALSAGHLFLDGSTMLLAQARAALEVFTGESLPASAGAQMARALASSGV